MAKSLAILFAVMLFGCANPFFKAVDGTDLEVAVAFPNEDALKVQVLHYLSGEKVTVRDPAVVEYEFMHSATNSYFGMVETKTFRQSKVKVVPANTNIIEKLGE